MPHNVKRMHNVEKVDCSIIGVLRRPTSIYGNGNWGLTVRPKLSCLIRVPDKKPGPESPPAQIDESQGVFNYPA